jgi:RHS repeat-associated protein
MTTQSYNGPNPMTTELDMQYNFTAGANNGRITSSVDGVLGETVNYSYDSLNRLSLAQATNNVWGQSFGYDGFGNMTSKTPTVGSAPSFGASFDAATNHQVGVSYDANGNPTGGNQVYDVENRMISNGAAEYYAYDHAGKRWLKDQPGLSSDTYELYFYGLGGRKLATVSCAPGNVCTTAFDTYFVGKLVKSKGQTVATDRLGSVRVTYGNSSVEHMRYFPYGEERTSTSDGRDKFGTYMRDNPGQDYADQRYYGVGTGRFNVPDPYKASEGAVDPSSWNRYGYTRGDPM